MANLLRALSFFVVFSLCLTGGYCTWWNPYEWRVYWIDWADKAHKESGLGEETVIEVQPTQALQKDGINVCAVKVPISVSRDCRSIPGRRRLKCRFKRYYVTNYQCCPGFAREKGKPGCPKELYVSKKNIIDIAKGLGLNQFVKLITQAGVGPELILDTKYTAFIPSNEAFKAIPKEKMNVFIKNNAKLGDALLFHVLPGKLVLEQLKHNKLLKTMDAPNKLRTNVCDSKKQVVVVQGGKIIKANQGASNGIVHVIDKFIEPSTGSLIDYLKSNPKLSILNRLLRDTDLDLSNVTLFAPSDDAFKALPADRLERLLSNKECLLKVLKYHLLDRPMYIQLLESARHSTVNKQFIDVISKDNETKFLVNDAKITTRDVTTDDAIVHVIDNVLIPMGAMEVIEAVKALNLTQLGKLLEKSSLLRELEKNGTSFTLLAPTDDAFELLPSAIKNEIMTDPKKLDMILKYHMIDRKVWTYEFGRDKFINSRNGMRLRLNSYRFGKVPAVNGACVKRANLGTCNGVIHVISKVLTIPENTIYDVLLKNPQFSNLVRIIDNTDLRSFLTNINGSITFFAPTNRAFARLLRGSPSTLGLLRTDPKEALRFLRAHLVNNTIYSCGLQCKYSYWSLFGSRYSVFAMSRDILRLRSRWDGSVYVNGIELDPIDVSASNGVLHGINKVIDWSPLALQTHWGRRRTKHHGFTDWVDWFLKRQN